MRDPRPHPRGERDRGATSVEFALVLPVALLTIGAIVVFALHLTYAALADHAARVGLENAVIRKTGSYPAQAQVEAKVDGLYANGLLGDPRIVTLDRAALTQGAPVTVTVVYDVSPVSAAVDLIPALDAFDPLRDALRRLATVTRVAKGRSE